MNRLFSLLLTLLLIGLPASAMTEDFIVDEFLKNDNYEQPFENTKYNYQSTLKIPINLRIVNEINSENDLYEGQIVKFVVNDDVRYNGKLLVKRNTIVSARVETIIANGMNGIPASIIFGNFNIPNINSKNLTFYCEKYGRDLSLLVFPLKWLLTPLYPSGSLTNFIKGGHVKIHQNAKITIYYYPS